MTASKRRIQKHGRRARALIEAGKAAEPKSKTFIYVNNRLEGNAIATIAAMIQ
jgi:hypothetical protein